MDNDTAALLRALRAMQETQQKQIACLTGFIGTLLGALQTKAVLHSSEIETLVEIFEDISPNSMEKPMQTVLNTVRVAAEETPHLMSLENAGVNHDGPPLLVHTTMHED